MRKLFLYFCFATCLQYSQTIYTNSSDLQEKKYDKATYINKISQLKEKQKNLESQFNFTTVSTLLHSLLFLKNNNNFDEFCLGAIVLMSCYGSLHYYQKLYEINKEIEKLEHENEKLYEKICDHY